MTGCGESAASKSPASRTGPIRSPRPKFEYKAGDKAAHGQYPTELEILPGDTVWIAFIGGDPHYSSITSSSSTQAESTSTKTMPDVEYEVKRTPESSESQPRLRPRVAVRRVEKRARATIRARVGPKIRRPTWVTLAMANQVTEGEGVVELNQQTTNENAARPLRYEWLR